MGDLTVRLSMENEKQRQKGWIRPATHLQHRRLSEMALVRY